MSDLRAMRPRVRALVLCLAVGAVVAACDDSKPPQKNDQAQAQEMTTAPPAHQWTTDEFTAHVYGKTKAQVRAEFGSPDNVSSSVNTWYYWHLNISDVRAGITVHSTNIRFSDFGGDADAVTDVDYN